MEGMAMGSRPIECMCNLPIEKKKNGDCFSLLYKLCLSMVGCVEFCTEDVLSQ